jgi:CRISPR/Cas system Type II protein with McrA/HNH and RuvC-like nuclease domain
LAHPKHKQVRQRDDFRCGYCEVSEVDTGGELSVDHYQPSSAGADDSDENLVYACFKCNQFKGDFFPTPEEREKGLRVLHPRVDDIASHLRENQATGEREPLTETGRFHITLLQLNRPALVAHRLKRNLDQKIALEHRMLEVENNKLRTALLAHGFYAGLLRETLGESEK